MIEEIKQKLEDLKAKTVSEVIKSDNTHSIHRINELAELFAQYLDFTHGQKQDERIREVLSSRVQKVLEDTSVTNAIGNGAKIILQMFPISALYKVKAYHVEEISNSPIFKPITSEGAKRFTNGDGARTEWLVGDDTNKLGSYTQFYWDSAVLAVDSYILNTLGDKRILSYYLEKEVMNIVALYRNLYKELDVDMPFVVDLTLTGVKEYTLTPSNDIIIFNMNKTKLTIDEIQLPYVIVEDYVTDISKLLKPMFDRIWNNFGFSHCYDYDAQGKWIERK